VTGGPRVHIWWHFHQPLYRVGERALLPWTKLHACRDYLDMADVIASVEGARATFNFTPVLLDQLRSWEPDVFMDVFEKPARDLTDEERVFILKHCFNVNWRTAVYPVPRYLELLKMRGATVIEAALPGVARQWTDRDFEDLQFLFLHAWCGEVIRSDPDIHDLVSVLSDRSHEDRLALLDLMKKHFTTILPRYRELHKEGRIALTTTPYAHPILPILVSPSSVARAHPDLSVPPITPDPVSARRHMEKARSVHEEIFGVPPDGLWPSEGSVSEECVPLFQGYPVVGTDEGVLRASEAESGDPAYLYTHDAFEGRFVFRDHALSDKIGFVYGGMGIDDAVRDFVQSVARYHSHGVVHAILDGENPWGGYSGMGREFLRKLYQKSASELGIDHARDLIDDGETRSIQSLFAGSWIDANFKIWIGDPVKNHAWMLLEEAKQILRNEGDGPSPSLMAAQGSDWFWWYGEGNSSPYEPEFDLLFRTHLSEAYTELNQSPPIHLGESLIVSEVSVERHPVQTIRPSINGRVDSYFEWEGAGRFIDQGDAMMGSFSPFKELMYGFDLENLYLRLDPTPPARADEIFEGMEIHLSLHLPEKCLIAPEAMEVKIGSILELSVPFRTLHAEPGDTVSFHLMMNQGDAMATRYPRTGLVSFTVPGPNFNEEMWCV